MKEKLKKIIKLWGDTTDVFKIYPMLKETLEEIIEEEEKSK